MNERIKEFARMSGLNVDGEESFSEFAEKTRLSCFAELIVRECIDAIKTTDRRSLVYTSYDADNVEGTIERVVQRVKERFDV